MIYGAAGANMGWVSYMYTSDDGVQWHYQIMDKGATHAKSIVGKNDLLTFGKQNVEYYDNQCFLWTGKDWKCVGQIADEYYNIVDGVYGNSGFVAVDDAGIIYASSDGQNWRKENSQSTVGFSKVIYGKNHYIAYNNNGELFIKNATDSTNAVWKKMELNTSICDIAYGDGKILVSSYDYGIMVNEAGGSANAYLSDVKFTNGKLADEFACGKFSYEVRVPQKVSELEIQPILMENGGKILLGKDDVEKEIPSGKMSYITIEDDVDSFYLKVVAENGVTYKKYFFDIQKNEQYFIEAESVTGGTVYGGGYGEVGEKIELSAKASEGYKFIGWYENGGVYSTEESISVTVTDKDRKFTPAFALIQSEKITIVVDSDTVQPGESYVVKAVNSDGEECECQFEILNGVNSNIYQEYEGENYCLYVDSYEKNDALMIRATLISDSTIQTTIRIPVSKETVTYEVMGICVPKEAGTVNGGGLVEAGQSVRICAKENTGYVFKNWNLDNQFYSDEEAFIISDVQQNYSLEAIYEKLALSSIAIARAPKKLVYYQGDIFEPDGMKVVAYYNDGSSGEIKNYTVEKSGSLGLEDNKVVISYTEGSMEKTVELAIQVLSKESDGKENSVEDKNVEETQQPHADNGDVEETQQPPADNDDGEETQQPPSNNGENGGNLQKPSDDTQGNISGQGGKNQATVPPQANENPDNAMNQPDTGGTSDTRQQEGKEPTYKINQKITKGKLTYQIKKINNKTGNVTVTSAKKNIKSIVIPSQVKVNGYTFMVTQIGKKAFYNQKMLTKVTIGQNVKIINSYAFAKCKKLKTINIKSTSISKVSKNAFQGIYKKNKVKIPKKCKTKYAKWMKKNKLNMR